MEHHTNIFVMHREFPPTKKYYFQPPPFFQDSLVWPPRSYSCTFCRREFRSAQALGGHMNVHRRDRARLKHSPPPLQSQLQESSAAAGNPSIINTHPSRRRSDGGEERECDVDEDDFVCKRHKLCSSISMEEIDLELRLGVPAVKLGQIS